MITWIQVILQKHHKVVFSILLVAIIVAFVFTIGSGVPFFGDRQARRIERKDVFGYNFEDPATMRMLQTQAGIEMMLRGIRSNEQTGEFFIVRYAYLSSMAEKLGIRNDISQDDKIEYIKSLPAFQNSDGSFNGDSWSQVAAMVGMDENRFEKVVMANAIAAKVEKLISGPGYALDGETKSYYSDIFGKWDVEVATMALSSFNPEIAVDDDKLKEYFNSNTALFQVPASYALDLAFFPFEKYAGEASFTDSEIDEFYKKNSLRYGEMKDGQYVTNELADVKDRVVADMKKEKGATPATIAAENLATRIYDAEAAYASEDFNKIISEANVELKQLPHLLPTDALPEGVPSNVIRSGFSLGSHNYYSDPILSDNGVWIVFLRDLKPAHTPEFASIKPNVEAAYKKAEKDRLFSENGIKAVEEIKAGLKEGKKFEELAKAKGFTVSPFKGFSFAESSYINNQAMAPYYRLFQSQLPAMKAGDVSAMVTNQMGGSILYAVSFEAPKAEANSEMYKNISESVKAESAARTRNAVYSPEFRNVLEIQ